jgi:hypothetical protein
LATQRPRTAGAQLAPHTVKTPAPAKQSGGAATRRACRRPRCAQLDFHARQTPLDWLPGLDEDKKGSISFLKKKKQKLLPV